MEIELQAILEVGAGICLGCLVAGAAFWIYALRRSKLKSSKETELPVYLGRDLKQAAILRKGSGSPDEESNSASSISRGKFFGWLSPQKKVDPTMEVYIPSTRKILSPTCPNSDSTPPAATPRIYVLPISPSGASPKSTVVPAKLDRRSKNSKQGELPGTPIAYIDSPTPGALVKVDKVPNPDILRSPVVREKEQGGTLGDLGCYGLESAESENLETKTVNNQVDRRSMDQSNLTCEGGQSPSATTTSDYDAQPAEDVCLPALFCPMSSVHRAPNPEVLAPSQNDSPQFLVGLPGLHVEVVDSDLENVLTELDTWRSDKKEAIYMVSLVVEEVLPRPDAGLLKRMLRMSEVPTSCVEGCPEPIFNLHPASQCHLSIGMIALRGQDARINISGPIRVSIRPIDGDAANLDVNYEQVDTTEHIATAFWDMNSHQSRLLTTVPDTSSSSTSLTPIEISFGFHVTESDDTNPRHEITVKKTILAKMRKGSLALGAGDQYRYGEKITQYVLSDLELVSMPSLLMFLRVYE